MYATNRSKYLSNRIASHMQIIFNSIDQALDWIDFIRTNTSNALKLLANYEDSLSVARVSNNILKWSNNRPEVDKFYFCFESITI